MVWHGRHYSDSVALKSINELNLARLQHHLKYCATYGVFYQLVEDFEKKVPSNKIFKRESQKLSPSSTRNKLNIFANY
jgi:hypothetical protein